MKTRIALHWALVSVVEIEITLQITDYRLQINTAFPRVLYSIDTRDTAIHESKLRSWWMVWLATKLIVRTDSLLKACYRA